MIEILDDPRLVLAPPNPALAVKERAYLECGCQVLCGIRLDNREIATMANPCSEDHEQIAIHFNMLLRESLVEPTDDPLVIACDRLLGQAEQYALGS